MKLVFTDEATADLREIADWIAAGNPRRALSFVDELKNRRAHLIDMRRLSADRSPDEIPVPSFGPRMVCTSYGIIGADARPNWKEQPSRESLTGAQWR